MSQRSGLGAAAVTDRPNGEGAQAAYWMDKAGSPGTYVLGAGKKALEATAFWRLSSGKYVLNDDPAEEDRPMYLVTSTKVIV